MFRIVAGMVISYGSYRVLHSCIASAVDAETEGKLRFGGLVFALAVAFTAAAAGMVYVLLFVNHGGQEAAIWFLIGVFGLSATYAWLEYIFTRGYYDDTSIWFRSIWCGKRHYTWDQLKEMEFSASMGWYLLTFENDEKVRISMLLRGHGPLLEKLERYEYDF